MKFRDGEWVNLKLTGHYGQVLGVRKNEVEVRYCNGIDMIREWFMEFEIESAEQEAGADVIDLAAVRAKGAA